MSGLADRRSRRLLALIASCVVVLWPFAVAAHTDFDSSTPADGATVDGPLSEVVVEFTNPAEPAGDGFELLDPSGEIREPTTIDPTDGTAFVLTFDPALTAGTYGLRWQVRAGDAHPIDGSFSFTVTGSGPASTSPPTSAPSSGTPSEDAPGNPPTSPATTVAATELADFLTAGDDVGDDAAWVGRVGRSFTFLGLIFGLGTVAALVWVIRGRRDEIAAELSWIRLAGFAVAVGGFIEWAGLHMTHDDVATELLTTKAGVAVALKIVGGLAVLVGFHTGVGKIVAPPRSLSAASVADRPVTSTSTSASDGLQWSPTASAAPGLIGFALVLASFWFDGHTVSRGWWPLHAMVNLVHVLAAAVWAGGVFAMTTIVWMRRRATEPTDTAAMVVRFSSVAAVSLAAVTVAGGIMAFTVIESLGDLFSSQWGRVLVAKLVAVAVGAGIGAYNHFRLRPALERSPDDPALATELRRTLTIESVVFVAVILLTGWLVAAAT